MRLYAFFMLCIASAAFARGDEIQWAKDWDAATKAAGESKKLIMIDFYTDWCGWCKRLDKDTYSNAAVIKSAEQFVSIKLDADKAGKPIAKKYGVTGYPTILFVDAKGEEFGRIGGYMAAEPFRVQMEKINQVYTDLPKLEAALTEKPDDGATNARIAPLYATRGKFTDAATALARAEKAGYQGDELAAGYLAVGDGLKSGKKFTDAIAMLKKADALAKNDDARAQAKVSLMQCYFGAKDLESGKRTAQEIIDLKAAPKEQADLARRVLEGLKSAEDAKKQP